MSTAICQHPQEVLQTERAARAEAERVIRLKDELVLLVSHELRSPVSTVLWWSELLRNAQSAEDLAEGLDVIENNARAQLRIIDDLLDFGRIMTGKMRLDLQPVWLAGAVEASVTGLQPAAARKGVCLDARVVSRVAPVLADQQRIEQGLRNLIFNAIKFTPSGGRVTVLLRDADGVAELSVIDTGQGIDPQSVDHVFDCFWQASASTVREDGLGLGLWIVKQIVGLHGGTAKAHSAGRGNGAKFIVTLPLLKSALLCRRFGVVTSDNGSQRSHAV